MPLPNDKRTPTLNAFSVDVEEHFQVSAFARVVRRDGWDSRPSRVEANTDRILDLLDEYDVKGTFFILGWVGERRPQLVRRIAERGHEIGSHGYSHRLIYTQTPDEFRDEAVRAKRLLEDACGCEVRGHRAASFSITRQSLWALDILVEAGFAYDSSLFPVVHDLYGIPGAPRGICRLKTPAGTTILEVPPSTLRLGKAIVPVAGGGYFRIYPYWVTRRAVRRLNRDESMPAIVYLHPWEVDPGQPRIQAPIKSRLRHYSRLHTTEPKLRRLFREFSFGPMQAVIDRERSIPQRLVA
ncbi:MAG: DUF3473 domain-containing protein [bacterium]|nr:DUF3473 domain-containing protein [bacterium]